MDNVCLFSGELDGDFAVEATFSDHGGVNRSSGKEAAAKQWRQVRGKAAGKKSRHSAISAKKVPTPTLTTNWVRKRR